MDETIIIIISAVKVYCMILNMSSFHDLDGRVLRFFINRGTIFIYFHKTSNDRELGRLLLNFVQVQTFTELNISLNGDDIGLKGCFFMIFD